MRFEWLPIVSLVVLAGCGLKSPGKATVMSAPGYEKAPAAGVLTAPQVRLAAATPPPVAAPTPLPGPSAEDLAYLRWLIQFDAATQQIVAQQAHDLPSAFQSRDQNRLRAMLKSWQDSRAELSQINNQAAQAEQFTRQLQQIQTQFQSRPAPSDCQHIAAGYGQVLAGFADSQQFNARLYREFQQIIGNPRAATAMLPADLQDGGAGIDTRLKTQMQSARDTTNGALSDFSARFPGQMPPDIAAFRVK